MDQFAKELKQCGKGDSACANAVLAKYIEISEKQSGLSPSQLDAYYAQVGAWAEQASADCQTSACRQQVDAWRTLTKLAASGSEEQTLMNLRGLQLIVKSPAGVALDIGGDVLAAALNFAPVLAGVRAGKVAGSVTSAREVPENAALHEVYKNQLRAAMEKPAVSDDVLSAIVDKLYRPNATVGNGSTAAAVRQELATGQPVGGAFHSQKASESIVALQRWLERNPAARPSDRAAAENLILDLTNALKGR